MEATYYQRDKITEFITHNREGFEQRLLTEAVNVASKINDILQTGNIDLLKNAEKLVLFVVEEKENELIAFAQQEGMAWAKYSLTLSFKLEWVQAIRRTLWHFLYQYDKVNGLSPTRNDFYDLEMRINNLLDQFLNTFFISYSNSKDEIINAQKKLVQHLSVPIIPLSPYVAVLPLIGNIDLQRMKTIEEKVLQEIAALKIPTLILDLSGVAFMEADVMHQFHKVLSGVSMMGCKAVITGLRADLVKKIVQAGIPFEQKAETKGTLQQTLKEYLVI
ncbi:STAS domain-containing protein [Mesobacillus harenae]|uniref:STAS domain-containing protein n=1 Tax=Mesobacillus harenae TaxID=2213203 RepID=UPI00158040F0|nr:STAS domain-containing protein [Mesobacillus harenae]